MVFLCNNLAAPPGVPLPPACPQGAGTVSGELTAAHVGVGASAQGVTTGEFAEFVAALRAEAAYGNLHTDAFPGGEIRGQVTFSRRDSINDDYRRSSFSNCGNGTPLSFNARSWKSRREKAVPFACLTRSRACSQPFSPA